jgi:hypothetical protein
MKISTLIKESQKILGKEGDIDVYPSAKEGWYKEPEIWVWTNGKEKYVRID